MRLTTKQRETLAREHITGVCIRYTWVWLIDSEPVTRQVNALIALGLLKDSYYRDGIAVAHITDAGRATLAEMTDGTRETTTSVRDPALAS